MFFHPTPLPRQRQGKVPAAQAEKGNYKDVLAEGVVNAARLVSAAVPGGVASALGWMRAILAAGRLRARARRRERAH